MVGPVFNCPDMKHPPQRAPKPPRSARERRQLLARALELAVSGRRRRRESGGEDPGPSTLADGPDLPSTDKHAPDEASCPAVPVVTAKSSDRGAPAGKQLGPRGIELERVPEDERRVEKPVSPEKTEVGNLSRVNSTSEKTVTDDGLRQMEAQPPKSHPVERERHSSVQVILPQSSGSAGIGSSPKDDVPKAIMAKAEALSGEIDPPAQEKTSHPDIEKDGATGHVELGSGPGPVGDDASEKLGSTVLAQLPVRVGESEEGPTGADAASFSQNLSLDRSGRCTPCAIFLSPSSQQKVYNVANARQQNFPSFVSFVNPTTGQDGGFLGVKEVIHLQNGRWLNDEIVNWHGCAVARLLGVDRSRIRLLNSGIASLILTIGDPSYERVLYNHLSSQERSLPNPPGISQFTSVIVPVCYKEHWVTVHIEPWKKVVSVYDSLRGDRPPSATCRFIGTRFKAYAEFQESTLGEPSRDLQNYVVNHEEDLPVQQNSYDCGVYACERVAKLLGCTLPEDCVTEDGARNYRAKMLLGLVETLPLPFRTQD